MKIRRYIEFIKESLKEQIEEGSLWKINEDDIREYLLELTDNGYLVTVTFGFVENTKYYDYSTQKYSQKDVFTEKALAGENIKPAYWIQIIKSNKITNEDVSDTLKFAVDIISENANAECSIHDEDGNLGNVDGIVIKGGLFYTDDWNSSEPELLETENYIAIFAKQQDSVTITTSQLADYYGWSDCIEKEGTIWIEIDLEDLAGDLLSSRSEYKDSLIKGQEHMWDYYDIQYYYPDINSLFSYTLEKETKQLLAKSLIKEFGGFEELKSKFKTKFESEQEFIDFLVEERFNTTFKKLIKSEFVDSEVYREVTDTVANWEMSAHLDDNYKEIVDEFDEIVEEELGEFVKVEKEVTKYFTTKDVEGNSVRRDYKVDVTYFQLPYSNRWIEDADPEDLFNKSLDGVFRDWLGQMRFDCMMNPRISDYGSADDKKMNEDIRSILRNWKFTTKSDPNQLKLF